MRTCWPHFTRDCTTMFSDGVAGKMVFHKHVQRMLGYISSRALRCKRPTQVPRKPRPNTVHRGSSFFRRSSDSVARCFGKVLKQCLAVYPQTHKNEKVFFWQLQDPAMSLTEFACFWGFVTLLFIQSVNTWFNFQQFLDGYISHTCQCQVWYFQHLRCCQDLCFDQQLEPGSGVQEPQKPKLWPPLRKHNNISQQFECFFGFTKNWKW